MLVALILPALIFGIGGFYLVRMNFVAPEAPNNESVQKNQSQPTATPTSTIKTTDSQILQGLLSLLKNEEFRPISNNTMWWVSDDNWSVLVEGSESIGLVRSSAYSELRNPNSETSKVVEKVFSYLINQGYSQNHNNSSNSAVDDNFYDFINGFENDKEKCLLIVNPDESYYQDENKQMIAVPNIVISCSNSNSFETSYNKQIPFLKSMNDREAIVFIQESTATAAKANVNWRRTGAFALFSKKNGFWEMIYRGQDQPSCETLEKYDFPKEIHSSCF